MPELSVDGGASANDLLLQLQADQLGVPVRRPEVAGDDRRWARRSWPGSAPASGRRPTSCAADLAAGPALRARGRTRGTTAARPLARRPPRAGKWTT